MTGNVSSGFLRELESRRRQIAATCETMLLEARSQGRETLNAAEADRYQAAMVDLRGLDEHIAEIREDLDRGHIPDRYTRLGKPGRQPGTAGQLARLEFGDEEMRRLQNAAVRGETCRIEHRDFSTADSRLPAQLFPFPIERQHESRILDRLPGYAMETASITFIRHTGTTDSPAPTAEGTAKPELVFNTDQITKPAVKLAAHNGLSWEIINDWPAFQSYCGTELYKQIIDTENDQLLNGDGTGLNMDGFFATSGILTEDATSVARR